MDRTPFVRGRMVEKIVYVFTTANKNTMFLIKFKDSPVVEVVPGIEANRRIPQMVIEFYMDHLSLPPPESRKGNPRKRKASEDGWFIIKFNYAANETRCVWMPIGWAEFSFRTLPLESIMKIYEAVGHKSQAGKTN